MLKNEKVFSSFVEFIPQFKAFDLEFSGKKIGKQFSLWTRTDNIIPNY
jgi:hypothetical protein